MQNKPNKLYRKLKSTFNHNLGKKILKSLIMLDQAGNPFLLLRT